MTKQRNLPGDHTDPGREPKSVGIYHRWNPSFGWAAFGTKPTVQSKPKKAPTAAKPTAKRSLAETMRLLNLKTGV